MEPLATYQREAKIKRINTLIYACKLTPNRPDILALWGALTFDDLSDDQLVECGSFMELAHRCKTTDPPAEIRRLRSQVMTLLNRAGKYAAPGDWTEVNRFLLQRKICGRLLYMLSEPELAALIRKLRAIADKKERSPEPAAGKEPAATDGKLFLCTIPGYMSGNTLPN